MEGLIIYLSEDNKVMAADAAEVARWYMECFRLGNFRLLPVPGFQTQADHVDYSRPFHEYDDCGYFLESLLVSVPAADRAVLRAEIDAFMAE